MTTSSLTQIFRREKKRRLDEQYVQDAFHAFLKSSLARAKAERLLDVNALSSAEGDLMITGPALCLYFAALSSTTKPPSFPLEQSLSSPRQDMYLSLANCPVAFIPFLEIWSSCVVTIQNLAPAYKPDLPRIICGLQPVVKPVLSDLYNLATKLRYIAAEISQRRSFQGRFASDLLDVSADGSMGSVALTTYTRSSVPSRAPTIATRTSPAIEIIRETLYAALATVLASTPSLKSLLQSNPPHAYLGAVALAILSVSTSPSFLAASSNNNNVVFLGVRDIPLTLSDCPEYLRPLMSDFTAIGCDAVNMQEEDDDIETFRLEQGGRTGERAVPRLDRARVLLARGTGYDVDGGGDGRLSADGRVVAFANRVNALALAITQLKHFKERQDKVFRVLAGVGSSL